MITGKNESKILAKDMSCECECKFDGRKCNSDQWWNADKCWCECNKRHPCEKDYICNPALCSCENGKYLASILYKLAITFDEIIEETKIIPTNFNEKNITCQMQNFYFTCLFIHYHCIIDSC